MASASLASRSMKTYTNKTKSKQNETRKEVETCLHWLLEPINQNTYRAINVKCVYDCGFREFLIIVIFGHSHRFSSFNVQFHVISMDQAISLHGSRSLT